MVSWITENMAIGELYCDYFLFDIIVNVAYINPIFNRKLSHRETRESTKAGKIVYDFGLYDSDGDANYLEELLRLVFDKDIKDKKVLFHCQAGKSRSVSFAITYLCKQYSLSIDQAIDLVKERRPSINPRQSFLEVVRKYIET